MGQPRGTPRTAQLAAGATREAAVAVGHFCGNLGAAPWGASSSVEKRGGNDLDRDICGAGAWLSNSVRSLLSASTKHRSRKTVAQAQFAVTRCSLEVGPQQLPPPPAASNIHILSSSAAARPSPASC